MVLPGICGQRRPRSDCASAQSAQGFRCLLTKPLDIVASIDEVQRSPLSECVPSKADLDLYLSKYAPVPLFLRRASCIYLFNNARDGHL